MSYGNRYFANNFFGDRYFGQGGDEEPPEPPPSADNPWPRRQRIIHGRSMNMWWIVIWLTVLTATVSLLAVAAVKQSSSRSKFIQRMQQAQQRQQDRTLREAAVFLKDGQEITDGLVRINALGKPLDSARLDTMPGVRFKFGGAKDAQGRWIYHYPRPEASAVAEGA